MSFNWTLSFPVHLPFLVQHIKSEFMEFCWVTTKTITLLFGNGFTKPSPHYRLINANFFETTKIAFHHMFQINIHCSCQQYTTYASNYKSGWSKVSLSSHVIKVKRAEIKKTGHNLRYCCFNGYCKLNTCSEAWAWLPLFRVVANVPFITNESGVV